MSVMKYYPLSWGTSNGNTEEKINEFIDAHEQCHKDTDDVMGGTGMFAFLMETEMSEKHWKKINERMNTMTGCA